MPYLEYSVRPLRGWDRENTPHDERCWPFKASWSNTLDKLERELHHLGASECIIEADFRERDIRLDGRPRANAIADSPRVILYIETERYGPLKYCCDYCKKWQDNVRAIAMTLERLRLAERYGVTKRGEQYTGFKALPENAGLSTNGVVQTAMTVEQAARWLAQVPGWASDVEPHLGEGASLIIDDESYYRDAYRHAAKQYHPDTSNGDEHQFRQLQEVKRVLDAHHAKGTA